MKPTFDDDREFGSGMDDRPREKQVRRPYRPPMTYADQRDNLTGTVATVWEGKGFAFIKCDDLPCDCFAHVSKFDAAITFADSLRGSKVKFDCVPSRNKPGGWNATRVWPAEESEPPAKKHETISDFRKGSV